PTSRLVVVSRGTRAVFPHTEGVMSRLPFGSDEPYSYLYSRNTPPDPSDGSGTVGGVADVMSIPLQGVLGRQASADLGGDSMSLVNLMKAMQAAVQSEDRERS